MHLIFQQYEEKLRRRRCSESAIKNMRRTATLYAESGPDPLTAQDWQIEEWLAGLRNAKNGEPLALRTKRLHAENLSAAYRYAVHRGLLRVAPTESVRTPREQDREPRILETSDLKALLGQAVTDQQYLMMMTLIYTGVRKTELRKMKWEDVSADSIRVIGKGGKLRHIPIHPALGELLAGTYRASEYLLHGWGGNHLTESGLSNRLEQTKGGIDCTFHDFRRTVATSLAENEVPEGIIDRIMGWAPRTVGSRYYIRRADNRLQEAILRLYADCPIN